MSKAKPKSAKEVEEYAKSIGYDIDGEAFIAHYEMVGWVYGKCRHPIKSWKAAVVTWKKNEKKSLDEPRKQFVPKASTGEVQWWRVKGYRSPEAYYEDQNKIEGEN